MAKKKKKSTLLSKLVYGALIALFAVLLYLALQVFKPNVTAFSEGAYVYIPTGATYEDLKTELIEQHFIKDVKSFDFLAHKSGYVNKIIPGKYALKKSMSNYEILKLLGSGKQSPVKIVINKFRKKEELIKALSKKLEPSIEAWQALLSDNNFLAQYGLDSETVLCAFVPNTYEFFWNTTPEKVFKKIAKEYTNFWSEAQKQKAASLGLSPQEVIILASIVEEETNNLEEKPTIARVYLNRLKQNMKLQADPTARYAYGDFLIKRITGVQTRIESPYNTYRVEGLPPGPICTPSLATINAVLQAPDVDYLYFCAKEDFSGRHNFASNLSAHNANARKYHAALNARGIR